MEIGRKLKEARLNSNFTQEIAADKIHVSRQTISNWENEKAYPDIISVIELSTLYEMSLDDLLKGDEKMLEKIDKDANVVKSNRKMIMVGWSAMLFAVILSLSNWLFKQPSIDFVASAASFVLLGIGLAIVCAYRNYQKN